MGKFTRREFLQITGAALAAAEAGSLLMGCGGDAPNATGTAPCRLHFNLSNFPEAERFRYHDYNGATRLERHRPQQTVSAAKSEASHLQGIPDAAFTHYVDTELSTQLVSTAYVTRAVTIDGRQENLLVHLQDNVPAVDSDTSTLGVPRHYHPGSRMVRGHHHPDGGGCTHVAGRGPARRVPDAGQLRVPGGHPHLPVVRLHQPGDASLRLPARAQTAAQLRIAKSAEDI
jgi:hypothetical protein